MYHQILNEYVLQVIGFCRLSEKHLCELKIRQKVQGSTVLLLRNNFEDETILNGHPKGPIDC